MKTAITLTFLLFSLCLLAQEKPEFVDKPYVSIKGENPIALDEYQITLKAKGTKSILQMSTSEIPNTIIPIGSDFKFIIDLKNQDILQGLVLYKIETLKKGGLGLEIKGLKAQERLVERTITLNFKEVSDGLYEIVLATELSPGDYAFNLGWTSFVFRIE